MTSEEQGRELVESVRGAVDDWVAAEDINVSRQDGQIVAGEEELVENISIMIAIAVDEAAE
jgi:hypothetical protein